MVLRAPVTVISPHKFGRDSDYRLKQTGIKMFEGAIHRTFIEVPLGATTLGLCFHRVYLADLYENTPRNCGRVSGGALIYP